MSDGSVAVMQGKEAVLVGLDTLAVGERAVLGSPRALTPTVLRLLELGMTPGTEVTLVRRAPFRDPLEVQVRGTRLCLRRADASCFPITRGVA